MKKILILVSTAIAFVATYIANMELASACAIGCYQPELPEE